MVVDLPEDVLINIACFLDVREVLNLSQTCRSMRALQSSDYVWHRIADDSHLPLDLPLNTPSSALSADELRRLAIKAIHLDTNWKSPHPRVRRTQTLHYESDTHSELRDMGLAPGGRWLWAAHSDESDRDIIRMSVWNLEDMSNPRRVWDAEVVGEYRTGHFVLGAMGDTATLVVRLCSPEDEFIELEVHTLSLKDTLHLESGISSAAPAVKKLGVILPECLRPAVDQEDFDIEICVEGLIVIANRFFGARPVCVLLVDPESGATTTWVEPELSELFYNLWARVWGEYLLLMGKGHDGTFVVRAYRIQRTFLSTTNGISGANLHTSNLHNNPLDDQAFANLVPVLSEVTVPMPRMYSCEPSPEAFSPYFAVIVTRLLEQSHTSSQLLRFAFDADSETLTLISMSASDLQPESSLHTQVGALGTRAVYIDEKHVVKKLSYDPHTGATTTGNLLRTYPPSPSMLQPYTALAFDEVTGRVCLGIRPRDIYVVDFA